MLQRKISVAAVSKAASTVGACLLGIAMLAACGQKGALILPKPPTAAGPAAAAPASSPASAP